MEKEKQMNYFIIKRLDSKKESDNLTNIYDLSILNNIKEKKEEKRNKTKQYFNNIIKAENSTKINLEKKTQILKVVKKDILSSNLTNESSLITFKKIYVFIKIFFFILTINQKIHYNKGNTILNQSINDMNHTFNNTNNYNNTFNTTNNDDGGIFSFIFNNTFFGSLINNIQFQNIYNFYKNIKKIILISFWLLYLHKLIPKWDKINDTIYKITKYLLLCESNENNNYFYYLMKDFSILVTKKKYYYENKNLLPILPPKIECLPDNNIILYCINIVDNFISERSITIKNYKLISRDDYNEIKVLKLYIEICFKENLKIYIKKILTPLIISIIINIINFNPEYELLLYFLTFILMIVCEFISIQYIQANQLNVDKFIDIFNDFLIKKNRFIYRKNKLLMYFALKNNNYTKEEIIKFIERIINSDY